MPRLRGASSSRIRRTSTRDHLLSRVLIHGVEATRRGARLRIDIGEDEPLELAAAVCPALRAGEEIDRATLDALRDASADHDTREAALRLLSYRARSVRELRDRLLRKNLDPVRVDRTLAALRDAGVLDDSAYSEMHAREAVRLRPRGTRRMIAELRRKGVSEAVAHDAVGRVMTQEDTAELELARRAAEGWFRRAGEDARTRLCGRGERGEVERVRRRFWGYMSRRGFGPDAVRAALEQVCA